MYLPTKYGTATINNIGDLLWVQFFKTWLLSSRSQWLKTVSGIPWPQHTSTNWILGLICHIVGDMLLTVCFACCRWVVLSVNCFCLHTTVMLTVCYINRQPGRGYHYSDKKTRRGPAQARAKYFWANSEKVLSSAELGICPHKYQNGNNC